MLRESVSSSSRYSADLDQVLAASQDLEGSSSSICEQSFELSVGGVTAREPYDLRRWSDIFKQQHKILVFGHHDCACESRGKKYFPISRITKSQVSERLGRNSEPRLDHVAMAGES